MIYLFTTAISLNIVIIFDKFFKCCGGAELNLDKCTFFKDKITFPGYVVSKHGVEVDESKIGLLLRMLVKYEASTVLLVFINVL
jgi:hypothetical protein